MKKQRRDYIYREIAPGIFMINEFDLSTCYLVTGENKALLIDCGAGIGDLLGFVKTLTDLPIFLAATHGHFDHIGGAPQFKEIYLHPNDNKMVGLMIRMRKPLIRIAKKLMKLEKIKLDCIPTYRKRDLTIKPVHDGDIIDLGGKTLTVHHTPGHTPGSVVFCANEDNILFTGDNLCADLWLHIPFCCDVETWLGSAEYTAELIKNRSVYFGHGFDCTPHSQIMSTIELGKRILRENSKNARISKPCMIKDERAGIDIQYRSGNIYKR